MTLYRDTYKRKNVGKIKAYIILLLKYLFGEDAYYKQTLNIFLLPIPKKLQERIKIAIFNFRKPNKITGKQQLIDCNKKGEELSLIEIEYGEYTVPGYIVKSNRKYSYQINNGYSDIILGFGILETFKNNIEKYDLNLSVDVKNGTKQIKSYNFSIPVNRGKTLLRTVGSHFIGKEFVDLVIPLNDLPKGNLILDFEFKYFDNKELQLNDGSFPQFIFKNPNIVKRHKASELQKIIVLNFESLTDPFWLSEQTGIKFTNKGFKKLLTDSSHFTNSYSQQDSTLPFMASFQTGLYSSQHGIGNYNLHQFESKLNDQYLTISKLLKNENFLNYAITPQGRWDSGYNWSKGFDTYKVTRKPWNDSEPTQYNLSNLISTTKNYNSFIFAHIDRVHTPVYKFVPSQSPRYYDINNLNSIQQNNFYPAIFDQISQIDKIIYDVIKTLKYEGIYDNSLIIISGDHGISIPPKWTPGLKWAQYEEHIRVPYIIKLPEWSKKQYSEQIFSIPKNATISIYNDILDSMKISYPDYFNDSVQMKKDYEDYAFSETIYHPKKNNYALSVISSDYKYWILFEVNWINLKMEKILEEKLFFRNEKSGLVDESVDMIDDLSSIKNELKEVAISFLNENLSFNRKYNQ